MPPLALLLVAVAPRASAAPEVPVDQRCTLEWGIVEKDYGWPAGSFADLRGPGASGAWSVDAQVVEFTPGANCGGSPSGCATLAPFRMIVASDDGARMEVRSGPSESGRRLVVGTRYRLSLIACGSGADRWTVVRGALPVGREEGAPAECGEPRDPPATSLLGWPWRPVDSLTREQVVPGGFDTEGVVASQFVPQVACPDPGTPCAPKPQLPRHIVLVGDDPAKGLLVAVPESTAFAVGARYRVSVVVCGTRFSGARINEGYLRAVEPAE